MKNEEGQSTVERALAGITQWRTEQLADREARLAEIRREMETVRATLQELEARLGELQQSQEQLEVEDEGVDLQVIERSYVAIFGSLAGQVRLLSERAARVAEAEKARLEATVESLAKSDAAGLYEEYRQYKMSVEPTLAVLPESYREVMRAHHERVASQLREVVGRLLEGPVTIDAEPLEVEVVYGIDAPEGEPELLIAVLPVEDEIHTQGIRRPEDLQTWVAARVAQAVFEVVKAKGPMGAAPIFGGHRGLLALEMALFGATGDFAAELGSRLQAVLSEAPELKAAKVAVRIQEVPVDYLLPPEDEAVREGAHA